MEFFMERKRIMMRFKPALLLVLSLVSANGIASTQQLETLLEPLSIGERAKVDNTQIISAKLLSRVYQVRQYQPLWQDKDYAGTILDVIKSAVKIPIIYRRNTLTWSKARARP